MFKKITIFLLVFLNGLIINGQDLHFTNFTFAPQTVNPSLYGGFAGTFRAQGITRSQWAGPNTLGSEYFNFDLSVDLPVIRGIRKQDWVGVGVSFGQDVLGLQNEGSSNHEKLTFNFTRLGLAYHLALNKKQNKFFSFGVQLNNESIKTGFNLSNLWEYQRYAQGSGSRSVILQNAANQSSGSANKQLKNSSRDIVTGISFTQKSKTSSFSTGISLSRFLGANRNLSDVDSSYLGSKVALFADLTYDINKKLDIEPMLFFQKVGYASEFLGQVLVGYKFDPEQDVRLKLGTGLRTGSSAALAIVGADWGKFRVRASYDMLLSGFKNANGLDNSLEIAVGYLGIINKTPKPKPIILCPRL